MRLASVPLEVLAVQEEDGIPLHLVPSHHPAIDEGNDQIALSASCYTKQNLILVTTPSNSSSTLELRTFHLHSSTVNAAPHHIQFPAPILPGIRLFDNKDDSILLLACTLTGYTYRIHIPINLLHSVDDIPTRWMVEQRLNNVSNDVRVLARDGILTTTHCSADGQIMLISCSDGKMLKLAWEGHKGSDGQIDGLWHESILRPSTFFGRLFGRGGSTNVTPLISSIATYARSTSWSSMISFTISQDRRMRVWDLGSDACIRTIDLPQGSSAETGLAQGSSNTEEESRESSAAPFNRSAFIRTVSASQDDGSRPYTLYVVVSVPASGTSNAFLTCYGVQLSEMSSSSSRHYNGSVGDIDLLWQRRFDQDVSTSDVELRDLSIIPVEDHWDIWCVWDASGSTVVRKLQVHEISSDTGKGHGDWMTVSLPISYSSLFGEELEEDLSALDEAAELGPFFVQRIVEPNRFSLKSLNVATKAYEKALLSRQLDPVQLPSTSSIQSNVREHILGLVGCAVPLRLDGSTGAPMYEEYFAEMKREWIIFVSLLRQADSNERWPVSFVGEREDAAGSFYAPFISSRGWLSLPIEEDQASVWLRLGKLGDVEDHIDDEDPSRDLIEFALHLKANIQPRALRQFEVALDEALSTQPSRVIEDVADALWTTHLVDSLTIDEDDLKAGFASIEADFSGIVSRIFAVLQGRQPKNISQSTSISEENTELFTAFASDALTQLISDRLSLARLLMFVVLSAHAGFFDHEEKTYNDDTISELVRQVVTKFHKLTALNIAAHIDGVAEVTFHEPKLDEDPNDADQVAKKIGELQFNSQKEEIVMQSDAAASNLVHRALLRGFMPNLVQESDSWFSSISQFASDAISTLISPSDDSNVIEAGSSFAQFANRSLLSGHPLAAIELMKKFPPSSAGQFIIGRSLLALGDANDASSAFEKVLPVFDHWSDEKSLLGSGLYEVLPINIRDAETADEAAFLFCRLAVVQFRRARCLPQVARFAALALSYASAAKDIERKYKVRELHLALFRSHVEMEEFADAYFHLLAIPFDDLQRESLRTLISIMCEQGRVEEMLSFNFAGLQAELERTLSFKARNSDPLLEGINYYHILYAFHVRRGDLKSAGATMWQMGLRIRDMYRRKVVQARKAQFSAGVLSASHDEEEQRQLQVYAISEAECYLSSINALSLINEENAWFAHEVSDGEDDILTKIESARLTSFLPSASFQSKTREIRIVHVQDVRIRYRLLLAQLELVSLYPDEAIAIMTSTANDANSAVELFVRDQDFERAFSLARSVDVNRTQIYVALTDRCLELGLWDKERQKRNKALRDGEDEHPLMQALFDDQDMSDFDLSNLGRESGEVVNEEEKNAPSARFLERSDRCVSWKGSSSQRAWRYLRLWLDMENDDDDDDGQDQFAKERYFIQVFKRILERQCWELTPKWLLEWLRENEANKFIRTLLDHDYINLALQESCELVKRSTEYVSNVTKRRKTGEPIASQTYLPYLLFDELLKRGEESLQTNPTNTSLVDQRQNVKSLRETIEAHKEQLNRIESGIRRNLDEDELRQRKLTTAALLRQRVHNNNNRENNEQDAQMVE